MKMGVTKHRRALKAGDVAAITGPLRYLRTEGYSTFVSLYKGEVVDVLEEPDEHDVWVRGRLSGNEQYIDEDSLTRIPFK